MIGFMNEVEFVLEVSNLFLVLTYDASGDLLDENNAYESP